MKKLLTLLTAFTLSIGLFSCTKAKQTNICIVKLGTHTSLNEIESSIKNRLIDKGYGSEKYALDFYNANFSSADSASIMQSIKNKADVVVAIATPVAQAAYNNLKDTTPIVFAAVSDPMGAHLVSSLESPTENITGTSDEIQVDLIIDKALEINPTLSKLGFIYNPSEDNSVSNKAKIEAYCKEKKIEVISSTIQNAGEMSEVASVLVNKVEAMFVTDDNTVASAMSILSSICRKKKIPCYTGADSEVKDGGMLCVGINYKLLGETTADMVISILEGVKIKDIPVKVFKDNLKTYLNTSYIEETNISIPSSILNDPNLVKITDNDQTR